MDESHYLNEPTISINNTNSQNIPGTFWFGRFDVKEKMDQNLCSHSCIEEANAGIAVAMAIIDDEEMVHFLSQDLCRHSSKSAAIKRTGYNSPDQPRL